MAEPTQAALLARLREWASSWIETWRVAPPFSQRRRDLLAVLADRDDPSKWVEVGPPNGAVCGAERFRWDEDDAGHHCYERGPHDVHTCREHGCRWRGIDPWATSPRPGTPQSSPKAHQIDPECPCDTCWKYTSGATYE